MEKLEQDFLVTVYLAGIFKYTDNFFKNLIKLIFSVSFIYLLGMIWLGSLIGWDKPIFKLGAQPFLLAELFKVKDSKNFEKIKLDGVKFAKSNGQITASYDKNKIKFDQIIEEVKNNVEILDISTDEGDLEDIFLQVTNK